jgi:hypothetical protein
MHGWAVLQPFLGTMCYINIHIYMVLAAMADREEIEGHVALSWQTANESIE